MTAGGRFWGSWQDQRLQRLQGTLIAPQIRLQSGEREPVLHDLFTRFEYVDDSETQQLQVQDLSLHLGEEVWPTTRLQLERESAEGHWSVALDRLRLSKLGTWLTLLAPDQPVADLVNELAPEGTLRQVRVNGIDPAGDLTSLEFSAAGWKRSAWPLSITRRHSPVSVARCRVARSRESCAWMRSSGACNCPTCSPSHGNISVLRAC
ncbi:hypothetical protein ULF88_04870 [Halopseudomonas pachastrellae]|nr:hypothetical protein [Halopseudomonas pachastrellae]